MRAASAGQRGALACPLRFVTRVFETRQSGTHNRGEGRGGGDGMAWAWYGSKNVFSRLDFSKVSSCLPLHSFVIGLTVYFSKSYTSEKTISIKRTPIEEVQQIFSM